VVDDVTLTVGACGFGADDGGLEVVDGSRICRARAATGAVTTSLERGTDDLLAVSVS
jgi:hypothetical protein